jgi:GTP-binding protein
LSRSPVVVIVGRPNVGKSTLFNRLTGTRRALVHDLPGVTRDRIVADAPRPDGGTVTLVDTGGLLLHDEDHYVQLIRSQAESALTDSDLVLFLVDGESGPLPEDREIANHIRALGVAAVLVVNKADRKEVELAAHEFYTLGLGPPVVVSAEHAIGIAELWAALDEHLAGFFGEPDDATVEDAEDCIRVAIIGRPNVGKSSLLNRIVGEPRVLVSSQPGTTRDAVDVALERDDQRFLFVDTAGIRRKGRTDRGPEVLSVVLARRHLERADLCLLVVDAVEGITRQDAHVAGYAWDAGRAIAVVVNKWDLVTDREQRRAELEDQGASGLKFVQHAPMLFLSALTGKGLNRLFPTMGELHRAFRSRTSTSELNRVLHDAWNRRPPPAAGRKAPKLYYAVQSRDAPPGYVLFTSLAQRPHFSYLRYLENVLRQSFGLAGVPIRVIIRGRER